MIKESFFIFVSQISTAFFGIIVAILTARFLGPEGSGIYAFLQGLIVVALALGGMGISYANAYFVSKKQYPNSTLFFNSLFIGFVVGVLSIGIIIFLYYFFPELFKAIKPLFILLTALVLPFQLAGNFFLGLLLGMQKIFIYALIPIIVTLSELFAFLIFLPIFPKIETAVYILICTICAAFIIPIIFFPKDIFSKPKINLPAVVASVKFGIKTQLGYIIQTLDYRLGIFLINFFLNPAAVGIFSISLLTATTLKFFSDSVAIVLFPKVSAIENDFESDNLVCRCSRFSFALTLLLALFLTFFSYWVVEIFFGRAFIDGVMALRILSFGMIFTAVTNILRSYIIGKGFPQYYTLISLVSLFFSALLSFFLIPKLGINGSAIAALISYFVAFLMSLYFYKRISNHPLNLKTLLIPTKEDFTVFHTSLHALIFKK
jgi:O-antigen/teichoic acid export membrane protein